MLKRRSYFIRCGDSKLDMEKYMIVKNELFKHGISKYQMTKKQIIIKPKIQMTIIRLRLILYAIGIGICL
jgi:hypothetical protein